MGLFASFPVDDVTVLDIAGAVGMTPAAIYYHFASKEQILLEGIEQFSAQLVAEAREHLPEPGQRDGLGDLVTHLLAWNRRNRVQATVFFINSVGLNVMVEAARRETRIELVELFRAAAKTVLGKLTPARAGVVAVALVSLLETATAANLHQDEAYKALGVRRLGDEVRAIVDHIVGIGID